MSSFHRFGPTVAALLAVVAPLTAQEVRLDRPAAVFPEDFGTIQTVREMPDGRVLVADPLGQELYLVDMAAGTRRVIGAQGQGPREYRQPDAVWPLPGDSTLLVDLGNGRLTVLGPDLAFHRTRPISQGGPPRPGSPLVIALPQGVDRRGNIYFRALGGGMGPGQEPPDSADVLRLGAQGAAEPVTRVKIEDRTITRSGSAGNQNVSMAPVPLSAQDAWGVAPDGRVAVARSGDYHLEWIAPDGSVTRGPAVPYDRVGIGQPEKDEWVADRGRTGGGIGISVEMNNGQASMTFQRGGPGAARETDQYQWPDAKPPFYGDRIPVDGAGRAWVRRHVDAGDPSTYDVFDGQGRRVATVVLDHGKRVVGFGSGAVYVVAFDEFDLNYLEKYAMPAL